MDLRSSVLLLIAFLSAAGCRKDPYLDAYMDMLNTEKRQLEDRIYQLEYDYEKALQELEACRAKLKDTGQNGDKATPSKTSKPKDRKKTLRDIIPEENLDLPKIELPEGLRGPGEKQTSHPVELRPPDNADEGQVAVALATSEVDPDDETAAAAASADAPNRVAYIYLNPRLTGGQDFDRQPGDDGLTVLIEPRDRDGQFVPQPAKISIVLIDPAVLGPQARVARWDFEPDVAAKVLRDTALDRGLHFRMPWPKEPPAHDRLQLFVRYWCDDGRKLEAQRPITVRLPRRTAQAWARRTSNANADPSPSATSPAPHAPASPPPASATTADRSGRFWKPTR
jgi:hypothetical protein